MQKTSNIQTLPCMLETVEWIRIPIFLWGSSSLFFIAVEYLLQNYNLFICSTVEVRVGSSFKLAWTLVLCKVLHSYRSKQLDSRVCVSSTLIDHMEFFFQEILGIYILTILGIVRLSNFCQSIGCIMISHWALICNSLIALRLSTFSSILPI